MIFEMLNNPKDGLSQHDRKFEELGRVCYNLVGMYLFT
jgi:hypothetical protein